MTENGKSDSLITQVLEKALPGRTPRETAPIALVYAGIRWGRDYRFGLLPEDENGEPLIVRECSGERYRRYLSWLAGYLYTLEAEPVEEQEGLCQYLGGMRPEDAVWMIGMNAALYDFDAEPLEFAIEEGKTFPVYWKELRETVDEAELAEFYDEESLRELFETVKREMETIEEYGSDIPYADAGYRLPLSVVLKKVEDPEKRADLLNRFYESYNNYASK